MSNYPHYPHAWQNDRRPAVSMPTSTPSVASAGWALGLSVAGCCLIGNIVSTVLAFGVLRRSRDTGHDHGNGLAVAALAVNAMTAGFLVIVLYAGLVLGLFETDVPSYAKPAANADPRVVTDVGVLEPGDCLDLPFMHGKDGLDRLVPCERRHDSEVIHRIELTGDRFPGDRAIDRRARACTGKPFQEYVGIAYRESRLTGHYFYPTRESWRDGDRTIVCLVNDPTVRLKGSVKGSAERGRALTEES